jgi:hypothetical protein
MNCDQAFQVMASVNGDIDRPELDEHLAGCASCRELAELFRPATNLFRDASDPAEPASAPESWDRVWQAVAVAQQAAGQLARREHPSSRWRTRLSSFVKVAALLALGAICGGTATRMYASGGQAARVAVADPGGLLPSATLADDGCVRCERLIQEGQRWFDAGACPTCGGKVQRQKLFLVSLCLVCHTEAPREFQRLDRGALGPDTSWPSSSQSGARSTEFPVWQRALDGTPFGQAAPFLEQFMPTGDDVERKNC